MPYYAKSEDWLHQSALLLQARPSTTRITTRYHIKPARRLPKPDKAGVAAPSQPEETQQQQEAKPPRGHLVLKTYDPASGVTLKYKTSKAAEVTRLVQMLGTLGRRMAGVAVETTPTTTSGGGDEVVMGEAPPVGGESEAAAGGSGAQTPTPTPAAGGQAQAVAGAGAGGGGGGGKGKKKKGKR
ncbi:signal recognition particle 9 kDa protein-domain-containing protein [Achaetomium macrosporum]|uniref:Signal recognition particle 9 kDa protein-domain-containing protein n=1 Tax=Achaetomium macrosporum TaxID=79813 RepID=A0AAN7HH69_9PEZI|nr:signal recognition particle 9 kDa protein-domain-containing protein [Achaetomium macrosporum]